MKKVNGKRLRNGLLQQLRTTVCLQTSLWDTCSDISHIFEGESDALTRVAQVTPEYGAKNLSESDLDAILAGVEEMNFACPVGEGKKIQGVAELEQETRRTLLSGFQNAIRLQGEFWIAANSLAEMLDCDAHEVCDRLYPFSVTADTGMELDEMDLHAFLGEPEAEGYRSIAGPLKEAMVN